ncbi:hypothetical protein BDA96_10G058400 [Sorghum bicolor]|uniref:KIB1-4 beta-propeller domain-containing protein n=1 Tax=Sorghum bicolor TaxID=4558 RepID=A0A921PZS9_SORBI|nr:hypothetical protein BDA96_10G058400 [Sorghum bicolor]
MAAARHCPSWADLHPELVALVLKRVPSLADHVRLGAVCRSWRCVVQQEPLLPSLPWLTLLDGSFLDIADGEVHRMRVPGDVSIHGSVGHWLFLRRCLSGELLLMNHFSKLVVRLPMEANVSPVGCSMLFLKLVPLSTSGLLPDSLFAVLMITAREHEITSEISICRRRSSTTATTFRVSKYINDIACFDGKLYALSLGELFVLDIVSSHQGNPRISYMKRVAKAVQDHRIFCRLTEDNRYHGNYWTYLVKSRGKLLHIRRLVGWLSTLPLQLKMERTRTVSFEVFELDFTTGSRHRKWRKLYTLGDQALFIGPNSKSLSASECAAQADCIYFVCDYDHENWMAHPLRDSGVFNMRTGRITPLLLDGSVVQPQGRRGCATWFFPAKACGIFCAQTNIRYSPVLKEINF